MEQTHMYEEDGFVYVTLKMEKEEYAQLIQEAMEEIYERDKGRDTDAELTEKTSDKE